MLPGLAAVWVVGGVAVYRTYRSATFTAIDSENMTFIRMIRMSQRSQSRGGPGLGRAKYENSPNSLLADENVFYQVWDLDGQLLTKSDKLAEIDLPLPKAEGEAIDRQTLTLPSLARVRTVGMTFGAGHSDDARPGSGPPGRGGSMAMIIVVARDLSEAEARLKATLFGITGAGLLMLGGMALLLRLALRNGLQPLDQLASAVSEVDPSSLNARFSTGDEPLELKPIVSHLDKLMDRVEKGFSRERRFGADLAHELRTPIAEMRTKLDLAATWPEEQNEEFFTATREINKRMQRVVDTMLQLAHLENPGDRSPVEAVPLAPLIAETWEPLKERAEARKLITKFPCPDEATVPGNPELWKHILSNLFSNAVDYSSTGGTIRFTLCEDGLSLSNPVEEFPTGDLGQMFERFWRADGSRSDGKHSGLGLSLVQACAHDMGFHASASLETHGDEQKLVISVKRTTGKSARE